MPVHESRFDDVARQIAGAMSRRQALRMFGAGIASGLIGPGGVDTARAQRRCRRVGEKCKQSTDCCVGTCCGGVCCADGQICRNDRCVDPPPATGPNREICVCGDGTIVNVCATLDPAPAAPPPSGQTPPVDPEARSASRRRYTGPRRECQRLSRPHTGRMSRK
jgi:hypothetical protein